MSPISTDVLFHFTPSISNLVDILSNEFRPHISFEDLNLLDQHGRTPEGLQITIPLCSCCDIPLSQSKLHMATYGNYAIGLTKEWGMRNGVAPVLYTYAGSTIAKSLWAILQTDLSRVTPGGGPTGPELGRVEHHLATTFARLAYFLKPYEGRFVHRGALSNNIRFYDEREWRYVPENADDFLMLSREECLDVDQLARANENARARATKLPFEPSDIRFLVVETESEILPLVHEIERVKRKYSNDEVKILTTRIVSAERISADF